MPKINLNELARAVAKKEKGRKQVDIAQIKEVIKCTFVELGYYQENEVLEVIERTWKKYDI